MRNAEHALGTMTVWLGFGGTSLVAALVVTMTLLERRFNPGGTLFLSTMIITYIGLRFFARRHDAEQSLASLTGLTLAIVGQLCIVALTITSVGLLLLPVALMSLGLLIVAMANQIVGRGSVTSTR